MKTMNMLFISADQEVLTEFKNVAVTTTAVQQAEAAVEKLHQADFDLVAIDEKISGSEKAMLRTLAQLQQPEATIILFENPEQLKNAVNEQVKKVTADNKPVYSFIDNGFRHHFLYANDNIG